MSKYWYYGDQSPTAEVIQAQLQRDRISLLYSHWTCTLDGERATITGHDPRVGVVRAGQASLVVSWEEIERIILGDRKFLTARKE